MSSRFAVATVVLALALPAAGQEEAQYNVRVVAIFNQHLYYGSFVGPRALAFDRQHAELWIADTGNGLLGVYRPDGAELYAFSSKEYLRDAARIAIMPNGRIAVIEGNREHIRTFDYRGNYKGDIELAGMAPKPMIGAIAFDAAGNLYVGENRTGQVFVYNAAGRLRFQFGSKGSDEGQFESIAGMAIDGDGTVYVIDHRAIAVQAFDNQGNFLRGWGKHEMGAANFSLPSGIAVDGKGHAIVSDELRHQVKVFTTEGKFLTQFGGLGEGAGQISFPTDVAVGLDGRIYVSERTTSRVQLFELTESKRQ